MIRLGSTEYSVVVSPILLCGEWFPWCLIHTCMFYLEEVWMFTRVANFLLTLLHFTSSSL